MSGQLLDRVDDDLVRALAWCLLGGAKLGRPHDDGSFRRAKALGLLAQDPVWRTTERGDGVLVALGLLKGAPEPPRTMLVVLWARTDSGRGYPVQFVAAWPEGIRDCMPETHDANVAKAQERWRMWGDDIHRWEFFETVEFLARPTESPDLAPTSTTATALPSLQDPGAGKVGAG